MSTKVLRPINYSAVIIYKLCCKDVEVTEIYVGHTTNFKQRKKGHKGACTNEDDKSYNTYVYKFIRDHGGWINWDMIQICCIECLDKRDAESKERAYIEQLGAKLNKCIPTRTKTEYYSNNKEHIALCSKEYYSNNKEQIALCNKEYKSKNKEAISIKNKNYKESNKVKIALYHKEYYSKNKKQKSAELA